jgi:hypothetical protein
MRPTAVILPFVLWGCRGTLTEDSDAGTIVGNPGDGLVAVAPSEGIHYDEAWGHLNHISLIDCNGEETVVDVDTELDLLAPPPLDLPSGRWCELNIDWLDGVLILGSGADDSSFEAMIEVFEVRTSGDFTLTEDDITILEIGRPNWLTSDALDLTAGQMLLIEEPSPLHQDLVEIAALESATFDDSDFDGDLSEDERDEGPLSAGENRDDQPATPNSDTGSSEVTVGGCGTGQGAWLFVFAPLLWRRQRRPTPRSR